MLSQLLKFVRSFFSTFLPAYKLWLSEWAEVCWARCHNFSSVTTSCQSNIHPKAFRQGWSGQIQEGEHAGLWHKLDPQEFVLNQCCHELSIHWRKNINAVLKMLLLLGGCRLCGNNLEIFRREQKADSCGLLIRLMLQVWFILPSLPAPQMDQNPTHSEQSGSKMGLRRDNIPAPRISPGWFLEWLYHQNIPHPSLLWNTTSMLKSREEGQTTQIASFKCMKYSLKWGSDG